VFIDFLLNLTWQNPEQLFVAQELINKVKSKCCGIKVKKITFLTKNTQIEQKSITLFRKSIVLLQR